MKDIITTSSKPSEGQIQKASQISIELNSRYVPRENLSLSQIFTKYNPLYILVVESNRETIVFPDRTKFFYHPNLAQLRLNKIHKGEKDALIEAMGITKGDKILDCTLGLAADALVASYATGEDGSVIGLEQNKTIAFLVERGLKTYDFSDPIYKQAAKRIEVYNINYSKYLNNLAPDSFDTIYFDPMFTSTIKQSDGLNGIRKLASYQVLSKYILEKAVKCAKKRVVVKARKDEMEITEFKKMFTGIFGTKNSKILYYYIDCAVRW